MFLGIGNGVLHNRERIVKMLMNVMETYIVRIYRRAGGRSISGVLIEPVTGVESAFHNIKELTALLQGMRPVIAGAACTTKRPRPPRKSPMPAKVSGKRIKKRILPKKGQSKR